MTKDNSTRTASLRWPATPYRGLEQYGPAEAVLFAGREADADACVRLLAARNTRIFLLHGTTGSGKSSLLRAALIPMMTGAHSGFEFLPDGDSNSAQPLFVRSTDTPLSTLAAAIYDFASQEFSFQSPRGRISIDLSAALLDSRSSDEFRTRVSADHSLLLTSLRELSSRLPRTLVLIIDQGEEVITLSPGKDGEASRDEYFRFISALSRAELDIKLLVALRTEFYGRFRHQFQRRLADVSRIADYYLAELDSTGLLLAILRPTERESIDGFGSPFDHYAFEFEEGLPERIVEDLTNATPAGGVLPAMQIVCSRLYQKALLPKRETDCSRVTVSDYESVGGIDGQINDYIDEELDQACRELRVDGERLLTERGAWKQLLSELVRPQVDGTVTADLKSESELAKKATGLGCKVPFQDMMRQLCSPEHRLCRQLEVLRKGGADSYFAKPLRPQMTSQGTVVCFSLAHDALGPPLLRWGGKIERLSAEIKKAATLLGDGGRSFEQGHLSDAIARYDEVIRWFGEHPELQLEVFVAWALFNKGVVLDKQGEWEREVATYDEVLRRFGKRTEVPLAETAAKALVNKGVVLGKMGNGQGEVEIYDEVVHRFGERSEVPVAEQVAKALLNTGVALAQQKKPGELAVYNEVLSRFGERSAVSLEEYVAKALFLKGDLFYRQEDYLGAVTIFEEVISLFGERTEVSLSELVAKALVNKGYILGRQGNDDDANEIYDDVVRRFGESTERPLRRQVACALNNFGFSLMIRGKQRCLDGDHLDASRLWTLAETKFSAALKRDSLDPVLFGNAGYVAFLLDREAEARMLLSRAMSLGGEELRASELEDADIHSIPRDEEFRRLVRSL